MNLFTKASFRMLLNMQLFGITLNYVKLSISSQGKTRQLNVIFSSCTAISCLEVILPAPWARILNVVLLVRALYSHGVNREC